MISFLGCVTRKIQTFSALRLFQLIFELNFFIWLVLQPSKAAGSFCPDWNWLSRLLHEPYKRFGVISRRCVPPLKSRKDECHRHPTFGRLGFQKNKDKPRRNTKTQWCQSIMALEKEAWFHECPSYRKQCVFLFCSFVLSYRCCCFKEIGCETLFFKKALTPLFKVLKKQKMFSSWKKIDIIKR